MRALPASEQKVVMKPKPIETLESKVSTEEPSGQIGRRRFFETAGVRSAALAVAALATSASAHEHEHHDITGPLSSASISFGQWRTTPPLDRFPNISDRFQNQHQLIPAVVKIKAGGSVNFIIAGLHQILIYGDGTEPTDINPTLLIPVTVQPGPPLINDPANRIYRGLDPSMLPQDRVEVVHLEAPGVYLVVCGVLPHFLEGMMGYIQVLPCDCR